MKRIALMSSGISSLTIGYIPKAGSPTTIINSAIDDGVTTAATVTINEPMNVSGKEIHGGGSQFSGSTFGTFNGNTPTTTTQVAIVAGIRNPNPSQANCADFVFDCEYQ